MRERERGGAYLHYSSDKHHALTTFPLGPGTHNPAQESFHSPRSPLASENHKMTHATHGYHSGPFSVHSLCLPVSCVHSCNCLP